MKISSFRMCQKCNANSNLDYRLLAVLRMKMVPFCFLPSKEKDEK